MQIKHRQSLLAVAREEKHIAAKMMSRINSGLAAVFSLLLPLSSPTLIALIPGGAIGLETLSTQSAYAQSDVDWFRSGEKKYSNGDYRGAINDFTKAIDINPQFESAYRLRGFSRDNLDDHIGAIEDFTSIIEINGDDSSAYAWRGSAKIDLDDYQGAITDLNQAIEIDPMYGFAYFSRAYAKKYLNDIKGAISDMSKAIELEPLDQYNYSSRGLLKEEMGDLEGACSDWRKASELGHETTAEWVRNQC